MESGGLINLTQGLLSNLDKIDNYVDELLEGYKDYADTVSDIVTPAKTLNNLLTLGRKIKLKGFLKNYARQINEHRDVDEGKLRAYFTQQRNVETIADIIDCALNGRSVICSSLLGVLAGKCLTDNSRLSYEDAAVAYALRSFQDIDLYNFIIILLCEQSCFSPSRIPQIKIENVGVFGGADLLSMTLQKLNSLQICLPVTAQQGKVGYKTTKFGHTLMKLIEQSGVIPEEHVDVIAKVVIQHTPPSSTDQFISYSRYLGRINNREKPENA